MIPRTNQETTVVFTTQPDVAQWVDSFLLAKRAEGLSTGTTDTYKKKLAVFLRWCDLRSVANVEDLTPDHLRKYLLTLTEQAHNPGGVHAHYRPLKAFLKWYEREVEPVGWRNPIGKVKAPKLPDAPLEPADIDHVSRLLAACAGSRLPERDKAILLTLCDTGLRASELTALDVTDLEPATGTLTVRKGKGGKSRSVFLGDKARRAMRQWLRVRTGGVGPLFANESGGRLTYFGLRELVRRLAGRAGVPEPPLHSFRRLFALSMLRNG